MVETMLATFAPFIPWFVGILIALIVFTAPMPGRGPMLRRRDVWRGFRFEARRRVMERAGGRCEGSMLVYWFRCGDPAVEADHVYPWSKGGPTIVTNGQALCRGHNRAKSSMTPPWWYVLTLERRRRRYFPSGESVTVRTGMSGDEVAARDAWLARSGRQR